MPFLTHLHVYFTLISNFTEMNQADISRLVSKLRIKVSQPRKLRNPEGPEGRLKQLRQIVNALVKYERLELHYIRADEARGYAERVRIWNK